MRLWLAAVAVLAVTVVLAVVRSAYDGAPTPAQQRCERLQVAANSVPDREDTIADEVEYLRLAKAADRACHDVG